MSVSNGQTANQTTFNNAFMSRTSDTSTVGKVDLSNAEAESGSAIVNSQRELNSLASYTGKTVNVAKDNTPTWTSDAVGASGDNLTERVEALTAEFESFNNDQLVFGDANGKLAQSSTLTFDDSHLYLNGILSLESQINLASGAVTGLSYTNSIVRLLSPTAIHGINKPSPVNGDVVILISSPAGAGDITIVEDSASAASAAGILTGNGNYTLKRDSACIMVYNQDDLNWHLAGGAGGGGTQSVNTFAYPASSIVLTSDTVQTWRYLGPSAVIVAASAIDDSLASDGTIIRFVGTSGSNTVTLENGNGYLLNGNVELFYGDTIDLQKDDYLNAFVEVARSLK